MSEKLDGIRGYWDGNKLLTRHGNDIPAPTSFTEGLPNASLDGELWMGRGTWEQVVSLIKSNRIGNWSGLEYYLFDLPTAPGDYEQRMSQLKQLSLPSHVHVIQNIRCIGRDHLEEFLAEVTSKGGEGVMIREPHSQYTRGISTSLLKVKVVDTGQLENFAAF